MKYFETSENKTLKLTNVLIKTLIEEDFENFEKAVEQIENYIKSKGYQPLGPLIQYTTTKVNENGELDVIIKLMRQVSNYINHVGISYIQLCKISWIYSY